MLTDEQLLRELENRFKANKDSVLQLQKITAELQELNKKLEESEALKTHFISNITNEIINPFAAILGLSRNILDVKKEDWARVMAMVQLIHSEAFNLDFQLKNIFAAAKLEAGEFLPEIMNVDVNQLIKSMLDTFRYEAEKKKINLIYELEPIPGIQKSFYFLTDPEKLRIILSNLVSNAINFSFEAGEVEVKAWLKEDNLCLSVTDYGQGVSDANKKIIFDRFRRLDPGINSLNRGHGLGLSVNKAIIDLLDGTIELESEPGQKTTFTVCLPPGTENEHSSGFALDGNEFMFDSDDEQVF
ncbi:MAG: sensor histidine kinase [Bacteroidales bacterium]